MTKFSPPHTASKDEHDGRWRVHNADGGIEHEADCKKDAEDFARFMDVYAHLEKRRQIAEGHDDATKD